MKKLLLFLSICAPLFAWSATLTVSNNPLIAAQYTTIGAALSAANPGDTIIVAPSGTMYAGIAINKPVVLIGSGYLNQVTSVSFVTVAPASAGENPSGLYLSGLSVSSTFSITANYSGRVGLSTLSNIIIERCRFGSAISVTGGTSEELRYEDIIIRNNLITNGINFSGFNPNGNVFSNFLITNNLFSGGTGNTINAQVDIFNFNGPSGFLSMNGASVVNNLFIKGSSTGAFGVFNNIRELNVANNIFYNVEPINLTTFNSATPSDTLRVYLFYNNNINYLTTQNVVATPLAVGANNLTSNPNFVSFPGSGDVFSVTHDYNLQAGSPAIGAGTSGTNIGLTGGSFPYTSFGNPPRGPRMQSLEITSERSVPAGTSLEVNFRAGVQN
jgi:hypothetical protein